MASLFLLSLSFLGLSAAAARLLNIRFEHAPFFTVSFLGILLYLAALAGWLRAGTLVTAGAGFGFAVYFGMPALTKALADPRKALAAPRHPGWILAGLLLFSMVLTRGMGFTVVDDYVFWGIAGKSLTAFHSLPGPDTTIIPKHLAYTPGTTLIHYFFHAFSSGYVPSHAYFAQAVILAAALVAVAGRTDRALVRLCIAVILLSLFCGSVFTKLQVDFLLSAFFLGALWIYFGGGSLVKKLVTLSAPLCFLFLIKQIGAMLALALIIMIGADILVSAPDRKQRFRALGILAGTGLFLYGLKFLWTGHCAAMGFTGFDQPVTPERIRDALRIFEPGPVRDGFLIFIRSVVLGPADRLNLPYLAWYTVLTGLWVFLFRRADSPDRRRFGILLGIFGCFFGLYLVMLYFLQIIVFKVGGVYDHGVGMTRYMNILFSQAVIFSCLVASDRLRTRRDVHRGWLWGLVLLAVLLPGVSRIQTAMDRDPFDREALEIARRIRAGTDREVQNRIFVVSGTYDNHLGIKLLYHLLPDRVNYRPFPPVPSDARPHAPKGDLADQFEGMLAESDYVLFYHPGPREGGWVAGRIDSQLDTVGFYGIVKPDSGGRSRLDKIF